MNNFDPHPKRKVIKVLLIVFSAILVIWSGMHWLGSLPTNINSENVAQVAKKNMPKANKNSVQVTSQQAKFVKPFAYTKKRKFVGLDLDGQNRPQGTHIQLGYNQLPKKKRAARLTQNPVGFENFKYTLNVHGRPVKTWFYNRGHLVGYQFCGVNDAEVNMITETEYLNQGSLYKMNDLNPKGQLYYENKLKRWMETHKDCRLDYSVIPVYSNATDLVPSRVLLTYVGYNSKRKFVKISLGGFEKHKGSIGHVLLNNDSPAGSIDYSTGNVKLYKKTK